MRGFDAHTHLDFAAFDEDREQVLERARAAGIDAWVIAGAAPADWDRVERVAEAIGAIAVYGVHPWWVDDADALERDLAALARRATPWGIGETGLDHLRAKDAPTRALQRHALRVQVALARQRDVPVVLHCVRAYPDMIRVLRDTGGGYGMVHAWSGPPDQVDPALDLGLHISFGTLVLKPHATRARDSLRRVPRDRLLLETDSPDQPPPGRDRSEPADLRAIAEVVGALWGTSADDVLAITGDNARRLFRSRDASPS